jgi:hypothetical protein
MMKKFQVFRIGTGGIPETANGIFHATEKAAIDSILNLPCNEIYIVLPVWDRKECFTYTPPPEGGS